MKSIKFNIIIFLSATIVYSMDFKISTSYPFGSNQEKYYNASPMGLSTTTGIFSGDLKLNFANSMNRLIWGLSTVYTIIRVEGDPYNNQDGNIVDTSIVQLFIPELYGGYSFKISELFELVIQVGGGALLGFGNFRILTIDGGSWNGWSFYPSYEIGCAEKFETAISLSQRIELNCGFYNSIGCYIENNCALRFFQDQDRIPSSLWFFKTGLVFSLKNAFGHFKSK